MHGGRPLVIDRKSPDKPQIFCAAGEPLDRRWDSARVLRRGLHTRSNGIRNGGSFPDDLSASENCPLERKGY